MTARDRERRRMIKNVRRCRAEVEQLLADVASWNENTKLQPPIDVDGDGILTLMLQWYDQQIRELQDDVFPLSGPPPRLAAFIRGNQ